MLVVPSKIYSSIAEYAKELSPGNELQFIPVNAAPGTQPLRCYRNVLEAVEINGGSLVKGWRLWWFHETLIEAQAHVVWRSPYDKLVDITPNSDNESECLFLSDSRIVKNPGDDFVPSEFKNLDTDPQIDRYIECAIATQERGDAQKTSNLILPPAIEEQELHVLIPLIENISSRKAIIDEEEK